VLLSHRFDDGGHCTAGHAQLRTAAVQPETLRRALVRLTSCKLVRSQIT
jgi:hypothetical protein